MKALFIWMLYLFGTVAAAAGALCVVFLLIGMLKRAREMVKKDSEEEMRNE